VSIIVTCFEQGRWVVECLDSIRAQTFADWELIVIDDDSRDGTRDVVEEWLRTSGADVDARLVVNEQNIGLTRTLNRALEECACELIAYCGGDDLWHPRKLEHQVEAMDASPSAAFVYTDCRFVDTAGEVMHPSRVAQLEMDEPPTGRIFGELVQRNFIVASTVLYRRDLVQAAGGWDPDLFFEDWDLFLRLAEDHDVLAVNEPLVDYRHHPTSMSRSRVSPMLESRLRLLAKWLGHDPASDAHLYPFLQEQSWRLFKVHPDMGREHVAVAYAARTDAVGRLRRLVATERWAEQGFEVLRRVTRPLRRTGPPARSG
jgi:glycosyltransferase involved in cell wall biosynthesis